MSLPSSTKNARPEWKLAHYDPSHFTAELVISMLITSLMQPFNANLTKRIWIHCNPWGVFEAIFPGSDLTSRSFVRQRLSGSRAQGCLSMTSRPGNLLIEVAFQKKLSDSYCQVERCKSHPHSHKHHLPNHYPPTRSAYIIRTLYSLWLWLRPECFLVPGGGTAWVFLERVLVELCWQQSVSNWGGIRQVVLQISENHREPGGKKSANYTQSYHYALLPMTHMTPVWKISIFSILGINYRRTRVVFQVHSQWSN